MQAPVLLLIVEGADSCSSQRIFSSFSTSSAWMAALCALSLSPPCCSREESWQANPHRPAPPEARGPGLRSETRRAARAGLSRDVDAQGVIINAGASPPGRATALIWGMTAPRRRRVQRRGQSQDRSPRQLCRSILALPLLVPSLRSSARFLAWAARPPFCNCLFEGSAL